MTEEHINPTGGPLTQMYRRICELSELPYRRPGMYGSRTAASINELKAEGTRCFGGPAPRPANNEQGVQP